MIATGRWYGHSRPSWAAQVLAALLLVFGIDSAASDNVLVLSSYQDLLPSQSLLANSLYETLGASKSPVEMFRETLDLGRFPSEMDEQRMTAFIADKYRDIPLAVVFVIGRDALDFATRHRDVFGNAALVFTAVRKGTFDAEGIPPRTTGVLSHFDLVETLDLALGLQRGARNLVVVAGNGRLDRGWVQFAERRLEQYRERLAITYRVGEPLPELLAAVAALPRESIVLYLSFLQDRNGQPYSGTEVVRALSESSGAPVYSPYQHLVGSGSVGGYGVNLTELGAETARLGLRVLAGEAPESLPPVTSSSESYVVDWRELERWGLPEERLPEGTLIEFRDITAWERYREEILAVVVVVALQALAIVALWTLWARTRAAERALQESEERYRSVVEAQTDLVCRFLPDTTLTFVNDAFCRYFNRTREELVGSKFIDFISEAERPAMYAHVGSLLVEPRVATIENNILRDDGTVGSLEWVDHALVEDGRVVELQGIGRDVTQLRLAQHEAQQRREQVTHLTRVAMLGEISGALAHELNQPLSASLVNSQAAQRMLGRGNVDVEALREILDDVVAENRRAGEVIARLRALLKPGSRPHETLDINDVVTEALALVRGQLTERNVLTHVDLAPSLPRVLGDRVQLQQVLLNLLLNGADAMSGNAENDRQLEVVTEPAENGGARALIRDNGTGIDPGTVDAIFEPFVTTKKHGLGLGLSICRSIVTSHGGLLTGTNNLDRGATFQLTLPPAVGPPGAL